MPPDPGPMFQMRRRVAIRLALNGWPIGLTGHPGRRALPTCPPRLKRSNRLLSNIRGRSFAFSPRLSREFCVERPPPEIGRRSATPRGGSSATPSGERGMPGADAPAAARGVVGSTRVSHHGHAGSPGIPRAMVLTVSFALSRVTGLDCHPRRRKLLFADLMPASGHQDHATSPSAGSIARQARRSRPPHPAPAFVTLRNAPPRGAGPNRYIADLGSGSRKKFGKSEIDRL